MRKDRHKDHKSSRPPLEARFRNTAHRRRSWWVGCVEQIEDFATSKTGLRGRANGRAPRQGCHTGKIGREREQLVLTTFWKTFFPGSTRSTLDLQLIGCDWCFNTYHLDIYTRRIRPIRLMDCSMTSCDVKMYSNQYNVTMQVLFKFQVVTAIIYFSIC